RRLLPALCREPPPPPLGQAAPESGRPREGLLGAPAAREGRAGNRNGRAAVPEPAKQAPPHLLELLDGLDRGRRLDPAPRKLRVLGAPEPLARTLDRLDHEQIGHGLVVGEVRGGRGDLVRHCANGTQAIGTPTSDWRDFSVAEIQLSPSGRSTEA